MAAKTQHWLELGKPCIDNGWEIFPLAPGKKTPALANVDWRTIPSDQATWEKYAGNGHADCGIAVRTGHVVAIDIDCQDQELVQLLVQWCRDHLGNPLIRVGNSPRVALIYQVDEPIHKMFGEKYLDGNETHAVEILGEGQYFVAFGVHPDTGREFKWGSFGNPSTTQASDLTRVSIQKLRDFLALWAKLVGSYRSDWKPGGQSRGNSEHGPGGVEGYRPPMDLTVQQIREILEEAQPDVDDYHLWIQLGQALHHETDGSYEGLEIWEELSQLSSKWVSGECERRWSGFHAVGRSGTVTMRTYYKQAQEKGYRLSTQPTTDDIPERELSWHEMERTEPPELEWLVPGFLPAGSVGLLVAPGGSGKSFLTLQLARALATGTPFLEFDPGPVRRVLVLAGEDDPATLHRRAWALAQHLGTADGSAFADLDADGRTDVSSGLLEANGFLRSTVGRRTRLTHRSATGDMERTDFVDKLIRYIRAHDIEVVTLDPRIRYDGGEENSNEDATFFIETLEFIREQTGVSILVVHHSSKHGALEGALRQQAARGASALTDAVRWQANMAIMDERQAKRFEIPLDQVSQYVRLAVAKSNYSDRGAPIWLRRIEGGVLVPTDLTEPVSMKLGQSDVTLAEAEHKVLTFIRSGRKTMSSLRNLASLEGPLGISQNKLMTVLETLKVRGVLTEEVHPAPRGRELIIIGDTFEGVLE